MGPELLTYTGRSSRLVQISPGPRPVAGGPGLRGVPGICRGLGGPSRDRSWRCLARLFDVAPGSRLTTREQIIIRISFRDHVPSRWPSCGDYSAHPSMPSKQPVAGSSPAGRAGQRLAEVSAGVVGSHDASHKRRRRLGGDSIYWDTSWLPGRVWVGHLGLPGMHDLATADKRVASAERDPE
jgi:hypothetical protein